MSMVRVVERLRGQRRAQVVRVVEGLGGRYEGRYSWAKGCFERLEGKEARREYYARLERAASR
jgi:hypothetical protein